jgi:hypothetical protein
VNTLPDHLLFNFVTKRATLMRRSTVQSLPFQIVFRGLGLIFIFKIDDFKIKLERDEVKARIKNFKSKKNFLWGVGYYIILCCKLECLSISNTSLHF